MTGTRNRLWALVGLLPTALLLLGLAIFVFALGWQYLLNRPVVMTIGEVSTPLGPVALAGLCMAALTLTIWFVGAAILMARQTRRHGADYAQAYDFIDAHQFAEAIPLLERSISRGKESVEVLTLLAQAYAYGGQFSRGHRFLERAIELYPDEAAPYATLGKVFLLEGNVEQAIELLQSAANRDASAARWAELGFALVFAGRNQEALESLERASHYPLPAPTALRVYHRLMRLYTETGNSAKVASAAAKMSAAREGLASWEYEADTLEGTGYGQRINREVQEMSKALKEADTSWI
jgi:tetratricopeptide (TPR) repeat protein